ncbi:phosphomethylpyrimidine synthase ThiC [Adlercreutzia sp. DFI.6.23]|nr:phosphomethylpyrimidine synthase ThiC [Adlercreutzia sp. DFI.6.23]MCQ5072163.1 phosphomethylpyrimidine synthase ThiC [Adlercreutzia sp. DFI.6.23]
MSLDPARARAVIESAPPSTEGTCTMCGKMCAMKTVNDIMDGLVVDLDAE